MSKSQGLERKGGGRKVEMCVGIHICRWIDVGEEIYSLSPRLSSSVLSCCPNQQCMASPAGTAVTLS